ncbi:MAG: hypothetical protein WBW46_05225 [Candidatus Sulfotelmatobacter sp.]
MGGKTNATSQPEILGVQVTTSLYNTAIPLLCGKRRTSSRVIWYGYFGQSGGSGKKGKSGGKKGGSPTYQANLDLLIAFGPIWNVQSTWSNSYLYAYGYNSSPPFCGMGAVQFPISNAATASGNLSAYTTGYGNNLDFICAISFTPSTPATAEIDVYGDPLGAHTITEGSLGPAWNSGTAYVAGDIVSFTLSNVIRNIAFNWLCIIGNTGQQPGSDLGVYWMPTVNPGEQWLYNTYDNYANSGAGSVAWRPGNWEFGATYCNNASCTFGVGTDHSGEGWSVEFDAPVTGVITVYFGYTEENHDNPITFIKYEFEPVLGSGNEFSGSQSGQQILYPELSGFGGVAVDLGSSGTAPELDTECEGLYALTKSGQCNPADLILDIILSGNIFFGSGLNPADYTPLCFSHGLNFGGDPTRVNQLGGSGNSGSQTWPPTVSFPYVLPMAGGAGNASGSPFQILKDPPVFDQGAFNSDNTYNVNSIVSGSDGNYYRALVSTNADPVTGGAPDWVPYTGTAGTPIITPSTFDAEVTATGLTDTNLSGMITPGRPTDFALFVVNAADGVPGGWSEPVGCMYTKQVTNTDPFDVSIPNEFYSYGIGWANVLVTMATNGTPALTNSAGWGSGGIGTGPHTLTNFPVVKGQCIIAIVAVDGFGDSAGAVTLEDSIGTNYTVLSSQYTINYNGNPLVPYTTGAWLFVGFATETATISATMTLPGSGPDNVEGSGISAWNGLQLTVNAPFSDGLTDVRKYCHANSIFSSIYLTSQRPAAEILTDLCEIANCTPVWNGQCLDFYPYSEVAAIGGGYTYIPRTAAGPVIALDKNYFVTAGTNPPVTVKQENMQSVANILDLNYMDAGYDATGACGPQSYQSNSVRICDAEHASIYGPMNGSPRGFDDYLTDPVTATTVGWPIMKRQRFADPYSVEFEVPQTIGSLLDPMDLITVVDPIFGGTLTTGVVTSGSGQRDCRISELSEDKDGVWTLTCERFMYGMSAPSAPSTASASVNVPPQSSATVGSCNAPYFFEPTAALAVALGMGTEGGICIAVSNDNPAAGGVVVNVSTDLGESYNAVGRLVGNSVMGVVTADYPSDTSPDSTHTLAVNLSESLGALESYTSAQQAQLVSIALLDNSGSPGTGSAAGYTTTVPYEIIAYLATSLSSAYHYNLTPSILRGQLGTVPADHPSSGVGSPPGASPFVDLSDGGTTIFKYTIPNTQITGNVLYFKFQTFNQFLSGVQDISECTPYTYTLTGQTNPTSPSSPAAGGSYTISPNPCLYQGRSGGWSGIDSGSSGWTNVNDIYFPPLTVNYSTGAVTYSANDAGTTAFTGSGQTVFVCIYDPSHAGGTPTVDVQSTNVHATTPGYVYLGSITSAAAPTSSGGTGGSSGAGGPQSNGGNTYVISVNGVAIT